MALNFERLNKLEKRAAEVRDEIDRDAKLLASERGLVFPFIRFETLKEEFGK